MNTWVHQVPHILYQISFGSEGDWQNSHIGGENFLDVLSSKTPASETFDPSSHYMMKPLNSYQESLIEDETLTNLSDLVSNWSIARSNPVVDQQIAPSTCNVSINPSLAQCSTSNISHIKQDLPTSPIFTATGMLGDQNMGYMPYMHEIKGESQLHEIGASNPSLLRVFNNNDIGNQIILNNSVVELGNKFNNGFTDVPWSNTTSLSDPFGCLSNPAVELRGSKPSMKGSDSSESKNQGHETSASIRGCGTTRKGKKKRSEENSDAPFKKSKHESSTVSSLEVW